MRLGTATLSVSDIFNKVMLLSGQHTKTMHVDMAARTKLMQKHPHAHTRLDCHWSAADVLVPVFIQRSFLKC